MTIISSQQSFDRDGILKVLRADPIAHADHYAQPLFLARGEEYLDLQHLAAGVQHATHMMMATGGELSRKAVRPGTWDKLLSYLRI